MMLVCLFLFGTGMWPSSYSPKKAVGAHCKVCLRRRIVNIELLEEDGEAPFDAKICVSPSTGHRSSNQKGRPFVR